MDKTLDFYNSNVENLIQRYDSADMSFVQKKITDNIEKGCAILDIGFGSGRDILFLERNGYNVFGVDPIDSFIENIQFKSKNPENFSKGDLVSTNINFSVDVVISIAAFMHVKKEDHEKVAVEIKRILKSKGLFFLSFSLNGRSNDERFFENLNSKDVCYVFEQAGFEIQEVFETGDSLNRDEIIWATIILRKKD